MAFTVGNKLSQGRPKGAKNKVKSLREQLHERGFDLIDELLDRLPDMKLQQQGDILMELVQYVYPKLAASQIDMKTEDIGPTRQAIERAVLNKLLADPKSVEALRIIEAQLPKPAEDIDIIQENPEIESHTSVVPECKDKPDVPNNNSENK